MDTPEMHSKPNLLSAAQAREIKTRINPQIVQDLNHQIGEAAENYQSNIQVSELPIPILSLLEKQGYSIKRKVQEIKTGYFSRKEKIFYEIGW